VYISPAKSMTATDSQNYRAVALSPTTGWSSPPVTRARAVSLASAWVKSQKSGENHPRASIVYRDGSSVDVIVVLSDGAVEVRS
jgi:hypothetical protein